MCRYDDDYEWYVEDEFHEACIEPTRCEDCGRMIQPDEPGKPVVHFTAHDAYEEDERPYVLIALDPPAKFHDDDDPYVAVIADYDDARIEAFEALGFNIDEAHDPRLPRRETAHHYCCAQCRAGNHWLEVVCNQYTVNVTVMDLEQHRDEYTDDQLGPDFVTLETLARRRWRTRDFDRLIPVHVVDRLARDAAAYALAHGLAHA